MLRQLSVIACASALAWAAPENSAAADRETLPTGRLPVARLVDLAAERLDLDISYTERNLSETVMLRQGQPLSDAELLTLMDEQLRAIGYTTVKTHRGDALQVVPLADAGKVSRVHRGAETAPLAGFARELLTLERVDVSAVTPAVEALLSPHGAAEVVGPRRILISDVRPKLEEIRLLIGEIDSREEAPASFVYSLEHLSADRITALVLQIQAKQELVGAQGLDGEIVPLPGGDSILILAPASQHGGWGALLDSLDRLEPVETRHYGATSFPLNQVAALIEKTTRIGRGGSDDRWALAIDELTGSLIVTATAADHERIEEVLDRLADTPSDLRRPMRSFVIENRGVGEVVEVLSSLIEAGALASGGMEVAGAATSTTDREQSRGDRTIEEAGSLAETGRAREAPTRRDLTPEGVLLTADETTNTLIAVGTPRELDQIAALISQIDVRQSQVMLEVMLVALSDSETRDLGVELAALIDDAGTLFRLSSLFGLSELVPESGDTAGVGGPGGTGVILGPGDFSAVVRALETTNRGRTLSMPRVLVNNNQNATFDAVLQQPFASTNASDTVATTSFGGTQDAGTAVTVRPQIARGDHLVLEYSVSQSAFVGEASDPSLPPPRQQNSLTSVATIPDGYTIAVGGIELATEADAVSKTPLLGDVPLVGALFQNRSESQSRTRFFVFVRASVLRHSRFERLKHLSAVDVAEAGVDDGWPEVRPRLIR